MAERKTGQREAVPESGSDLHGTPGSDPRQAGRDREPDWLLIDNILKETLILRLIRTGSHSDLF